MMYMSDEQFVAAAYERQRHTALGRIARPRSGASFSRFAPLTKKS